MATIQSADEGNRAGAERHSRRPLESGIGCSLMRLACLATAVVAALLACASGAGATSAGGRGCGTVHASVPYSRHGSHDQWRVYASDAVSCAAARRVLNVVLHLGARQHVGSSDADSFFSYGQWRCPFGDMGIQTCELRSPLRVALAMDCATACPTSLPTTDFR